MRFIGFACLRREETLEKERLRSRFLEESEKRLSFGLCLPITANGGG
jgi:hypothetical protein